MAALNFPSPFQRERATFTSKRHTAQIHDLSFPYLSPRNGTKINRMSTQLISNHKSRSKLADRTFCSDDFGPGLARSLSLGCHRPLQLSWKTNVFHFNTLHLKNKAE